MCMLIFKNKIYDQYEYSKESEFEDQIIKHSANIFGENSFYINAKMKMKRGNIVTIPDAYLLDFSFESSPYLYIVEIELVRHDTYRHIGVQLLKFAVSYKASGRQIKKFLLERVQKKKALSAVVEDAFKKAGYRGIDDGLEDLIFEKPVAAIVVIDEVTPDLENVLTQLTMKSDILEFQTYICGSEKIHRFTPFQEEVRSVTESKKSKLRIEEVDTIVVPANIDSFNEVFLSRHCWYQIRISSSMIDRIKYIAGYQTAPVSAITHYAEVARIEKHKGTSKYIVHFTGSPHAISSIALPVNKRGLAPQNPRYTSFEKLTKAKTLSDVF